MQTRITIDPNIQHGKPVIAGTRVPVVRVLGCLAEGMSIEEIKQEYGLTNEDIRAVFAFAAELIDEEIFYPSPLMDK